ncbi:MAG: hypothetical protein JWM59_210 [Verrucomicrobiales bacterium]|nr:hypothetical protein [Verrucomicrobiales bacterium]
MTEPYIHLMPVEERSQAILPLFISIASFLLKTKHELISWLDGDFFEAIKVTISNLVATFGLLRKTELELIRRFLSVMVELSLNDDETEIYSNFLQECLNVINSCSH